MGSLRSLSEGRWLSHKHKVIVTEEPLVLRTKEGVLGVYGPCEDGLGMPKLRTLINTSPYEYAKRFLKITDSFHFYEHRHYVETSKISEFSVTRTDEDAQRQLSLVFNENGFLAAYVVFTFDTPPKTFIRIKADKLDDFEDALRQVLKRNSQSST